MEDILASIRRILSEDETAEAPTAKPAEEPRPESEEEPEDDVLVLDPSMLVAEPAPEPDPEPEPKPEIVLQQEPEPVIELAPAVEPPPVIAVPPSVPAPITASLTDLVAPAAAAAAASSVDNLVRTLAAGRSTQVYAAGPTIEDLVREEVRPLLKEWLDTHLPPMVERLVRLEIERVVGRVVP
jgi:cell pole-organizing protein PopZ